MLGGATVDKTQIATLASRLAGWGRPSTIRRFLALNSGKRYTVPFGD